jgi:hypothetical protein
LKDDAKDWRLNFGEAKFGEIQLNSPVSDVIIDSGTSFILMPDEDFYSITRLLSKNNTCLDLGADYSHLYVCLCTYP